jgi:glycine cleavage system H protein
MAQAKEFHLPDDLCYDRKEHTWARPEDDGVRVGLDAFGVCAAGTVAYVKLSPAGRRVQKGRAFGSLEAGKYVGPLKAPVGGTIAAVNQEVFTNPGLLNVDHYERGWLVVLTPDNLAQDVADLVHGPDVQPWLEAEVLEYEQKGMLKKEEERQCK